MGFKKQVVSHYKNLKHFLVSIKETLKHAYPARKLMVIGVTGTDGKTTTCHLIYQILNEAQKSTALISTIGAYFKDKKIDTGLHTTTPDATVLQPLISELAKKGAKYLVLEATSHGLDQHRVLGCNFSVGVLTNITHEHLDYHQTFEKYRKTKAKLFKKVKVAILNKDDSSFSFIKNKIKGKVISYSISQPANLRVISRKLSPLGTEFTIKEIRKRIKLKTKLVGDYNISNILAAIAVTRSLGISWEIIQNAISNFKGIPGRMEVIDMGQNFTAIVDFAHTPNALEKVLKTLRKLKGKGRIIAVLGCAGKRDVLKRPIMGKIATKLANISIFTAEDPRCEKIEDIIGQIAKGAVKNNFLIEPDRQKAINLAIKTARADDIVILCGKGHEQSMAYGNQEIPWDDRKAAKKALAKLME